jgi:hypothetical protein
MASTAAPYGLKPVNLIGGLPYAGSTRNFKIDPAGYAANIFNGSIVRVASTGYLELVTTTGADASTNAFPAGTVGVFVGCSYYNAQGQLIFSQFYPAGTTGDVTALVVDDDRAVFQVQANGAVAQAKLGENVFLANVQSTSTGNTRTGNSNVAVSASSQTAAAAFRVVGFVDSTTSSVGDAFTDILVKFNPGQHSYSNATGI